MKKKVDRREPSAASLREIPEVDPTRMRRLPQRGRYAHLATGVMAHAVIVDADLWEHFGSAKSVNAALRAFVEATRLIEADRKGSRKGHAA